MITVSSVTGTFDAMGRRVEIDVSGNYYQMVYPPFAPNYQMATAQGLTAEGIRMPLPGGGEAIFNSAGLSNYRHPNWQGSQVALSWATGSPNPNFGGAFTPFGEKYAIYPSGFNGYFAGMLGIADEGAIQYAYQASARLMQQEAGRWVSPDPAGLGAVDFSNPQSWNRYAYVMNNPLSHTDPSGLKDDCGGPCTPFSYIDGQGCIVDVTYYSDSGNYDVPSFRTNCSIGLVGTGTGIGSVGSFAGGSSGASNAPNNATPKPQQPQQNPQPPKQPWYCGTGNSWSHPFTAPTGRQYGLWSVSDAAVATYSTKVTGGKPNPVSEVFTAASLIEAWGWAACN